jgi:hypothetical protein
LGCRTGLHYGQVRWLGPGVGPGGSLSPRAGDSHQVGGEFPKDHFDLLMHLFPLDTYEGGVWHSGLYTVGGNSIQHRAWFGGLDALGKGHSLFVKSFSNVC